MRDFVRCFEILEIFMLIFFVEYLLDNNDSKVEQEKEKFEKKA